MRVRLLPAGDTAVLVEIGGEDGPEEVLALTAALRRAALPGVVDLVPAARTVLVQVGAGSDLPGLAEAIFALAGRTGSGFDTLDESEEVRIPVRYDGADLDDVARLTGLSRSEVIARHTGTRWRAAFVGFAPGFAYLTGQGHGLDVPRRAESRTAIPAGSVALAGGYSAVYPSASPGGWQIIGSTDVPLWDVDRETPSLIGAGSWVRFVDAGFAPGMRSGREKVDAATSVAVEQPPGGLEVLRAGPLSLCQDLGRGGLASIGVGRSGAADRSSFVAANRLLGNEENATAIECVLGGLVLRASEDVRFAVTGAAVPITVDGVAAENGTPIPLAAGQVARLGTAREGLRSYLAVRGGFDVPRVLGSASTDTLSGLGPAALRRGDRLSVGNSSGDPKATAPHRESLTSGSEVLTLHAIAGPRDEWFDSTTDLAVGEWVVSPNSNRVGIRLDRPDGAAPHQAPVLRRKDSRELPSEGLALGAVQVPPSGQPVLFLADHPVTGGYPVIAVVADADVDLAAQVRPGHRVRFRF